jgi:hypothetical protein
LVFASSGSRTCFCLKKPFLPQDNALLKRFSKSVSLQNKVETCEVPDYNDYVAPEQEMWLAKISRKCDTVQYVSASEFREDFHKILSACKAYNTLGQGRLANPGASIEYVRVSGCIAYVVTGHIVVLEYVHVRYRTGASVHSWYTSGFEDGILSSLRGKISICPQACPSTCLSSCLPGHHK